MSIFISVEKMNMMHTKYFNAQKLRDGVYACIVNDGVGAWANSGIVDLGNETIIIDTFLTPDAAKSLKEAAQIFSNSPIKLVFNSHWHLDHVMGNQVFSESEIIATVDTQRLLLGGLDFEDKDGVKSYLSNHISGLEVQKSKASELEIVSFDNEIKEFQCLYDSLEQIELTLPTLTFEKGLALHGTHRNIELHCLGAGHSANDSIMYLPDDRVIFTGDLVFVNTHPSIHKQSPLGWIKILNELKEFEFDILVPGHGEIGNKDNLNTMIDYLNDIVENVQDAFQNGLSKDELSRFVVPDKYSSWRFAHVYRWNMQSVYEQFISLNQNVPNRMR